MCIISIECIAYITLESFAAINVRFSMMTETTTNSEATRALGVDVTLLNTSERSSGGACMKLIVSLAL